MADIDKQPPALVSKPAELHFVLTIQRAVTGAIEHIPMVGHVLPPENTPDQEQS